MKIKSDKFTRINRENKPTNISQFGCTNIIFVDGTFYEHTQNYI